MQMFQVTTLTTHRYYFPYTIYLSGFTMAC